MKIITHFLTTIFVGILFTAISFGQGDQLQGSGFQFDVPQNIQSLQQQIKMAEVNENWDLYYSLRPQLIAAWQEVKPEIANLYRTTNSLESDQNDQTAPRMSEQIGHIDAPVWGNDLLVHTGSADDISLIVTRNDTLYLAALTSGSHVDIYVSGDGGSNWSLFIGNFTVSANKIELLDFDGYNGSSGPSYILLFSQYTTGVLWCTRFETANSSNYTNSQVVESGCTDFSVDRNYPATNYRCFVIYDSAATQYRKRSDPASYATLWQDPVQINSCKDPDIAYGFNGSLYSIYIGRNSGNLYLNTNLNFGDPSVFGAQITLETGGTDTTFLPEIIASRHDTANQTVNAIYNKYSNGRPVLYRAFKLPGAEWIFKDAWVTSPTTDEHKNSNLFCRRANVDAKFQGVYVKTGLGNLTPREIRYKGYSGGGWSGSVGLSDNLPTGLQNAVVVELSSGVAAYAYVGSGSSNVYFDRQDWVTDVTSETSIPEVYSLEQNYPNPFNPSTTIKFSIPEQTNVTLKIFNSIGQEVASLLNGEMAAGNHSVDFNASKLSSGVYFYRIDSPSFTSTKKMILIK